MSRVFTTGSLSTVFESFSVVCTKGLIGEEGTIKKRNLC